MATAEAIKVVKSVRLFMTESEARTLLAILGYVGGSPIHSPRKHAASIAEALGKAMEMDRCTLSDTPERDAIAEGSGVHFEDYA